MLKWDKLEGRVIKDGGKGKDRYFVQTSIGSGGAGKVYIAKDSFEDDRIVAIKTSNPQQSMSNHRERFNKEDLSKVETLLIKLFDSGLECFTIEQEILKIQGMHCASCAIKLEKSFKKELFYNTIIIYLIKTYHSI